RLTRALDDGPARAGPAVMTACEASAPNEHDVTSVDPLLAGRSDSGLSWQALPPGRARGRGGPALLRRGRGLGGITCPRPVAARRAARGAGGYGAGVSVPRRTTAAARLARLGFADPARAELLLDDLALDGGEAGDALIDALGTAPDPDLALAAMARMP